MLYSMLSLNEGSMMEGKALLCQLLIQKRLQNLSQEGPQEFALQYYQQEDTWATELCSTRII